MVTPTIRSVRSIDLIILKSGFCKRVPTRFLVKFQKGSFTVNVLVNPELGLITAIYGGFRVIIYVTKTTLDRGDEQ
jgi:hypothetical protein